jgi:hypothetical protein
MARITKKSVPTMRESASKNELVGRDHKEETLEKWYHVASLYVLKGMNKCAAYKQVYGSNDGTYSVRLFQNPRFLAIVERLRLSQCLDDDAVRKNIEALYLQTITDPDEQIKNKLAAASQWQKLRGLETQRVEVRSEVDDVIMEQLRRCEEAMKEQAVLRQARGRTLRPVEICEKKADTLEEIS